MMITRAKRPNIMSCDRQDSINKNWMRWAMVEALDQQVTGELGLLERCSAMSPWSNLIDGLCHNPPHPKNRDCGKLHTSREPMSGLSCCPEHSWGDCRVSSGWAVPSHQNDGKAASANSHSGVCEHSAMRRYQFFWDLSKKKHWYSRPVYCVNDRDRRKGDCNLMSLLMLRTLAVAVLDETLLVDHGMLHSVTMSGGVGQLRSFSHLYSILPSEQSCQPFTCTISNFPCSTWRFTLVIMLLHISTVTSSHRP